MKENKLLSICILILSLSIIFGSVWIGNSIRNTNKNTYASQSSYSLTNNKALMTDKETAEYLNLPQEKFNSLIVYEESQRKGAYDTYSFIPFVKVDGIKYFNKEQVDKWVEYHITKHVDINTHTK